MNRPSAYVDPQYLQLLGPRQIGRLDWAEAEALHCGAMNEHELERLRGCLEAADAQGHIFCSIPHLLASGQKP